jgi:hypothetical protein
LSIELAAPCSAYDQAIMAMPAMKEWITVAKKEREEIDELGMEL